MHVFGVAFVVSSCSHDVVYRGDFAVGRKVLVDVCWVWSSGGEVSECIGVACGGVVTDCESRVCHASFARSLPNRM